MKKFLVMLIVISFAVTCFADPVLKSEISATASSMLTAAYGPVYTVNGEGLWINPGTGNLSHLSLPIDGTMWLSNYEAGSTSKAAAGSSLGQAWVKYEFTEVYDISEIAIWNYNGYGQTGRGLYEVYIEYSADGVTWTRLNDPDDYDSFILNPGDGLDSYDTPDVYNHFTPFQAKYIAITALPNPDGTQGAGDYFGLSEVQFWHAGTNPGVFTATEPSPAEGTYGVAANVLLSWTAGDNATSHDVYLGTSFDAVDDANTTTAGIYLGSTTDPNWMLSSLSEATDYYWRVDESDGSNVYKGDVWRFTTAGTPIDPNLLGWWKFDDALGGSRVLDSSGRGFHADADGIEFTTGGRLNGAANFQGSDKVIISKNAMASLDNKFSIAFWQFGTIPQPAYNSIFTASPIFNIHLPYVDTIYWDCPGVVRASKLANESDYYGQWNHWVFTRDGASGQSKIYLNGSLWLDTNPGAYGFNGSTFTKDVVIGQGSGGSYQGQIDDLRMYNKVLSDAEASEIFSYIPPNAYDPSPANLEDNVQFNVNMSWEPGSDALSHDVYVGTDFNSVDTATTASPEFKINQAATTYAPALDLDTTYYWRIDEVDSASNVTKGSVWEFTTADYITIDEFEDYNSSNLITGTWTGTVDINSSMDYDGSQSMKATFGSEISRPAPFSDWTAQGVQALVIRFHGTEGNTAQSLTCTLVDGSSNEATVTYTENTDVVQQQWEDWITWNIDLADFTSVNLANITDIKLSMSSGEMFFDAIRLYPPRCVGEYAVSDIDGDCIVDINDLIVLADQWLDKAVIYTASAPASGLRLWYKLDETSGTTVNDYSGNNFHGTLGTVSGGNYTWESAGGYDAGCLDFDGAFIDVPVDVFSTLSDQITVSAWIKSDGVVDSGESNFLFHGTPTNGDPWQLALQCPNPSGNVQFTAGVDSSGSVDQANWAQAEASDWSGQWNHYAFVKDASKAEMLIYLNGILMELDEGEDIDFSAGVMEFLIGATTWHADVQVAQHYRGRLDDFRVYDVALTQSEVVSLADKSQVAQPLFSDADLVEDDSIDLLDLAQMASGWLEEQIWP